MAYENIPQAGATYLDGAFKTVVASTQPAILLLGTASSGQSYELFSVGAVREAEVEFGADSELMKGVHEAVAQGADNIRVMRIGGREGSFVFTDSAAATLTITPRLIRDDDVLGRYALVMDGTGTTNRILVYDLIDEEWVYDSDEILVLDEGIVTVVDTGIDLFSIGTIDDPTTFTALDTVVTGDFTVEGTATATSVSATEGSDGTSMTLVERYAALNVAYHNLDFKDADFVIPLGVYHDEDNVVDGDSLNLWAGQPLLDQADSLGYVWQYVYQGRLYTYFTDSADYFSVARTAATSTINTDLVITAQRSGAGINGKVTLEVTAAAAGDTVTATVTEVSGVIKIVLDVQNGTGTKTNTEAATAANAALDAFTMSNGLSAGTFVQLSGGATVLNAAVAEINIDNGTPGVGGDYVSHADLTGDTVPAAVTTVWNASDTASADVELREVNFTHQLGTFIHTASTTWHTMLGSISFKGPSAYDRGTVAAWIGSLPTLSTAGTQRVIGTAGANGSGVLGNKFMAGAHGYRNGQIVAGDANDGYAWGGLIKTRGASLPNELEEFAYGVLDTDEQTDSNGAPVDLGKFVLVTADWVIHRNSFNGGTTYRGPIPVLAMAKLATIPENIQSIGEAGVLRKISSPPRIHATQQDELVRARIITTRRDPGLGYTLVSARTAAHPDSDYTKSTTIRATNRIVQGVREIVKPFLGKPFSSNRLIAMKDAIDNYLNAERIAGMHLGAKSALVFDRASRIIGALTVRLRIVPPFSIEYVDIETSLAADESEL